VGIFARLFFTNPNGGNNPHVLGFSTPRTAAGDRLLVVANGPDETTEKFGVDLNGDVVAGQWKGAAIPVASGGTGLSSYAKGDLLYASGGTALARLAAGLAGRFLRVSTGGVPEWVDGAAALGTAFAALAGSGSQDFAAKALTATSATIGGKTAATLTVSTSPPSGTLAVGEIYAVVSP
jgi:hypothetical protein